MVVSKWTVGNKTSDFTLGWDCAKPLILCFSTMRSGSTKLLNIFRAASEALSIDIFEAKTHSLGYDISNLNCDKVGHRLILISPRRRLLDQAISLARTSSWDKLDKFPEKFIPLILNRAIEERHAEMRILEKCLVKGISFFSCDYSYLTLSSPKELLITASNFLSIALQGSALSEKQKASIVKQMSHLSYKYALDMGRASEISSFKKNFGEIDGFTHIHGNHIQRQNDPITIGIKHAFDEFGFGDYACKIDSLCSNKIINLCLGRYEQAEISTLQILSELALDNRNVQVSRYGKFT